MNLTTIRPWLAGLPVPALLLAAPAPAQNSFFTNDRGPLSSYAHTHTLDAAPTDQTLVKEAGDQQAPPAAPPATINVAVPDYDTSSMFTNLPGFPDLTPYVEVDAMSTGNDWLPVEITTGTLDPGLFGNWTALVYSVTSGATGAPGSWVESRALATNPGGPGPGADLLSLHLLGSTGLGPGLLGQVMLEQASEHMGYTTSVDIDSLDLYMPLFHQSRGLGGITFFRTSDLFFSVTSTSASAIDAFLQSQQPGPWTGPDFFAGGGVSGATILHLRWQNGAWLEPALLRAPAELGLQPGDDVDALAHSARDTITVFSVPQPSTLNQLRVYLPSGDPTPPVGGPWVTDLTHLDPSSVLVDESLDLHNDDDIDAICGIDPDGSQFGTWFGTPYTMSATAQMGLSITRMVELDPPLDAGDQHSAVVQVTGWGSAAPLDGMLITETYIPAFGLLTTVDVRPRTASEDVVTFPLPLPPAPPNYGSGLDVYVRSRMDSTLADVDLQSWISGLRL
ncbi:MAG: hypothetical protein GY711_16765 [bacterium]|nr:hypothetical protein [bacterium]